jgi:hypothetical protein
MVLVTGASTRPQASVAVQVSVIVPPQSPGVAEKVDVLEVPVIKQEPVSPLVYVSVEDVGVTPQAIVIGPGALIIGNVAGVTVMILVTGASTRPQASVAVQVSVIVPPQGPGAAENVDVLELPVIRQEPVSPLV